MTDRQEVGPARRPRRRRTLFPPGEAVRLSEASLPRRDFPAFSAGHRVATIHSVGLVHGDLHGEHMRFDPATGETGLIDFEDSDIGDVDPDRMFQDIVMVRMTKGESWARGFLGGYARTSRLMVDPKYPGYTDALLARAADGIASAARPADPVFTEAVCDALLGPVLDLSSGTPRLTADLPDRALSPDELTVVACALLVAGVAGADRLCSREPPEGAAERLLFATLTAGSRPADPNGLLVPGVAALRVFDKLPDGPAVRRCLAGMTDVYDWLALRLDRPGGDPNEPAFANCVRAAQLSLLLLQLPYWPLGEVETQELKVTARHRRLGWYVPMLAAKPSDGRYLQLLTYLGSRLSLYGRMFAEPSPEEPDATNLLWSANWRALLLSRNTLRTLLTALRDGTAVEASEEMTLRMTEYLATGYHLAVRRNIAATLGIQGFARPLDFGAVFVDERFGEELRETGDLRDLIRTERPGPVRLAASEQVSAVLARNAKLSGHDFDWAVAHPLAAPGPGTGTG